MVPGVSVMTNDEATSEAATWKLVGAELGRAREALKLSKRAAANRAGFSEITWRQLEDGEKQIAKGLKVPVSPKDDTLAAAAEAVLLDPVVVFELAGRTYERPGIDPGAVPSVAELAQRVDAIDAKLARIEEALTREGRGSGRGAARARSADPTGSAR
jgi:hypothetical protein